MGNDYVVCVLALPAEKKKTRSRCLKEPHSANAVMSFKKQYNFSEWVILFLQQLLSFYPLLHYYAMMRKRIFLLSSSNCCYGPKGSVSNECTQEEGSNQPIPSRSVPLGTECGHGHLVMFRKLAWGQPAISGPLAVASALVSCDALICSTYR